jgi:4'-phosphopantetheinyl transferase
MFAPRRIHDDPPVFALDIPEALLAPDASFDWLDEDNLATLRALGSAQRRAQFACGRWLLAHAAREIAPGRHRVRFDGRRPAIEIAGAAGAASISHSGRRVLCTAAPVAAAGVDIEEIRPRKDWEGLAGRGLHPAERVRLDALPEAGRWEGFYAAWTMKEALAKALGTGLTLAFSRVLVSEEGRMEEGSDLLGANPGAWGFARLGLGPGWAAAVVWRRPG